MASANELKAIIASMGGQLVSIAGTGSIPQLVNDDCKTITGIASPTTEDDARNAEGIWSGTGVTNHALVNKLILNEDQTKAPMSLAGRLWLVIGSATYARAASTPPKIILHGLDQEPRSGETQRLPSAASGSFAAIDRVWTCRPDNDGNSEITLSVVKRTVYKVDSDFLWFCEPTLVPLRNANALLAAVSQACVLDGTGVAGVMFSCST